MHTAAPSTGLPPPAGPTIQTSVHLLPTSPVPPRSQPHLQQRRRQLLLPHAAAEAHRRQLALHRSNVLCHVRRCHRMQRL